MHRFQQIAAAGLLLAATMQSPSAEPPPLASPWVAELHTRVRLVAGGPVADAPPGTIAVGVEIELAEGWKTCWRNPGSSGVPPLFDWSSSSNVASASVRYPAPLRLADRGGDTIGYKQRFILPVAMQPADPRRDVTLKLGLEYGVCKDICIPAQARLELAIPSGAGKAQVADALAQAFDRIPRPLAARRPSDPNLSATKVVLDGDRPAIRIEAVFPGGAEGADVFVDVPGGVWIPMAKPEGPARGTAATFVVDLTDGADIADLRGKSVSITLVSPRGQSETSLKLE